MTDLFISFVCGLFVVTYSQDHHDICEELMIVDCTTEALPSNKIYRDNHGKIYENFCTYSQAKCRDKSIDIDSICTCVQPNIPDIPTTTITKLTSTSVSQKASVKPTLPDNPTTTIIKLTTTSVSQKAFVNPTATVPYTSTMQSVLPIQGVFCNNKDNITCSPSGQIFCGSDGKTYSSKCDLNKTKCNDPGIYIVREGPC